MVRKYLLGSWQEERMPLQPQTDAAERDPPLPSIF